MQTALQTLRLRNGMKIVKDGLCLAGILLVHRIWQELNMENRVKKRVRFFLFVFLVKAMFLAFFPCTVSAEAQKDSSWTSYFSRYLVFWETDDGKKSEKEVADQKAWKKIAVDFNDFLPDNLPGVAEYRRAARYQLWENQPSHTEQEVYDLYGVSARKGNVLALMKQYEMYLDNQDATDEGKRFFPNA